MRALVISGGGSKGAFAGGIAQYLIEEKGNKYDLLIGTSTGSLLIPHLALGNISKIHELYTNFGMQKIFSISPFIVKQKNGIESVKIHHFNVLLQFLKGKRTFGESKNLRRYIEQKFSIEEFNDLKNSKTDIVVTVTNLSKNQVEYKSLHDFDYQDFLDWIWISCNYVPFMSLVSKNNSEYGDGGFTSLVPIREAIQRGATEIDVVILDLETNLEPINVGKNPFSLMVSIFSTLFDQVEKNDITIGKLAAKNKNVKLNLYYTPEKLTTNSLIFNKEKMKIWWQQGFEFAKNKEV